MLEAAGWEESGGQKWLQDIDQNGELSMGLAEKLVQVFPRDGAEKPEQTFWPTQN